MANLQPVLYEDAMNEFLKADRNIKRETVQIRVLKKVLNHLRISKRLLKFMLHPETVFIHPQVSDYLIEQFSLKKYKKDYIEATDVDALCDELEKTTDPDLKHKLNIVFAIDGYRGKQLKKYRDNLRIGMSQVVDNFEDWETENEDDLESIKHVRAVRHLYETHGSVNSEIVHLAIQHALDGKKSSTDMVNKIAKTYIKFIGEENVKNVKEFIETKYVCFVE